MKRIAEEGHIHFPEVPEDVQRVFVTAHDITPEWHVRMQAAFQEYTDSAISKTTNFPHEATADDVREIYELAFKLGCKGVTVYRDGSRDNQVLSTGATKTPAQQAAEKAPGRRSWRRSGALRPRRKALTRAPSRSGAGAAGPAAEAQAPAGAERHDRKMNSPLGDVYVTINEDEGHQPFEVFATLGKAGSIAMADTEAIGRLISLALRFGIPVSEVHQQLRGISSTARSASARTRCSPCPTRSRRRWTSTSLPRPAPSTAARRSSPTCSPPAPSAAAATSPSKRAA
jgi:ribonucleoside-diphosphate reductase alpha chain